MNSKSTDELIQLLKDCNDELDARGISSFGVLSKHVRGMLQRGEDGRMRRSSDPAPLPKSTGASAAQIECATAEMPLQINLAAQERATARPALAQERSKLDFSHTGHSGAMARNIVKEIENDR